MRLDPKLPPTLMANVRNHDNWMRRYQLLVVYAKEHGHALVPRSYVSRDGFKLGIWTAEQRRRRQYHDARETAALEALPGWMWDARNWRQART
jgi:hypothetical protein